MRDWYKFIDKKPESEGIAIKIKDGRTRKNVNYDPKEHDNNLNLVWTYPKEEKSNEIITQLPNEKLTKKKEYVIIDIQYVGTRIREIRQNYLLKNQNEIYKILNEHFNTPDLFTQPRVYQIEILQSMGPTTLKYIEYLVTLGFNSNWIICRENKDIPFMNTNSYKPKYSLKDVLNIRKHAESLKAEIDAFNETIEITEKKVH